MAKKTKEKKVLDKKGWISSFFIVGEARINDYTYTLDKESEKSDWIYNMMNLGIYCGDNYGIVHAELMGGYSDNRKNVIYTHGIKDDGTDDYENRFEIDWEDRFDEDILETVGRGCFLTVGLEKDKKGKVFYKKFLSPYDAIAYINEHLEEDMVVNIKGKLKYSTYNDNTQCKKEINSIVLSKVEDKEKYYARFTQTMLLDKDSIGKIDKETGVLEITANVLDYVKTWKEKEVKTNIPFMKEFEYEVDKNDSDKTKKIIKKLFKVTKGVTEITFEGDLIEGNVTVNSSIDDIDDDVLEDVKELLELGLITEEEINEKYVGNANRSKRMVIRKPSIKVVEDEKGEKSFIMLKTEEKYSEDDLQLDFMLDDDDDDEDDDIYEEKKPKKTKSKEKKSVLDDFEEISTEDEEDDSWLEMLDDDE